MKKYKWHLLTVVLLSILVTAFMVRDRLFEIVDIIGNAKVGYILILIIMVISFIVTSSLTLHLIIKPFHKQSFLISVKQWLIINFASNVTPANLGTGPTVYYLLRQEKMSKTKATQMGLLYMAITKVPYLIIFAIAIVVDLIFNISSFADNYLVLIVILYTLTLGVLLIIVALMTNKRINTIMYRVFIKFYKSFKLSYEPENLKLKFHNYLEQGKVIMKEHKVIFKSIMAYLISVIIIFSMNYFIFKAIGLEHLQNYFLDMFIISSYISLISTILPIPGSIGGVEASFYLLFASVNRDYAYLTSALFLYRFFTYYLLVGLGLISLSFYKGTFSET